MICVIPILIWVRMFIPDPIDDRCWVEKDLEKMGEVIEVLYLDKDFNIIPG